MTAVANKGAGSVPNAPDAEKMIRAQGDANLTAARQQQQLNQTSQITPYGTIQYVHPNPADPTETVAVQSLNAGQQQLLNQTQDAQGLYGSTINSLLGNSQGLLSNPITMGSLPGQYATTANGGLMSADLFGQNSRDLTNSIMDQLQPGQDQQSAALATKLRNQGLTPGSEAYGNATRELAQSQTQARLQAVQAGSNLALQQNQQAQQGAQINNAALGQYAQTATGLQATPLQLASALLGGSLLHGADYYNTPTATVGQTDALGAYQNEYQDRLNSHNTNYAQNKALINYGTDTISKFASAYASASM